MKPAPFDYFAPATVDGALSLLREHGSAAKVLAGGQSLVPAMNFRLAQPAILIDLNNIPDLAYIRPAGDGGLALGAMTRDSSAEHSSLVAERAPLIPAVMPFVAYPAIRNRGTVGGALAHADPSGQLPAVAVALSARCRVRSKARERWVPADEFFVGFFATALDHDELLVEVQIPPLPPESGWGYRQVERQVGAGALVGVAAVVTLDRQRRCANSRIVLLSVGEGPVRAARAAASLAGQAPSPEAIAAAADLAARSDIDPGGDIHASPAFRRHLAAVLTRQALTDAFGRASKEPAPSSRSGGAPSAARGELR